MSENIIQLSENYHYVVEKVEVTRTEAGIESVGTLTLRHLQTSLVEELSIWTMEDDLTSFYVCLPTNEEDEEDPMEVYSLEVFGFDLYRFDALNDEGMKNAATSFIEYYSHNFNQMITLDESFKALQNEVMNHLYDYEGCLLSEGGLYDEITI